MRWYMYILIGAGRGLSERLKYGCPPALRLDINTKRKCNLYLLFRHRTSNVYLVLYGYEINEICSKHDLWLRLNSRIIAKIYRNTASFQNSIMKIKDSFLSINNLDKWDCLSSTKCQFIERFKRYYIAEKNRFSIHLQLVV